MSRSTRASVRNLGWISLNKVHQDHREIELKYLPVDQRSRVEDTIPVSSLSQAKEKASGLAALATTCKKVDEQKKAEETQKDLTGGKPKDDTPEKDATSGTTGKDGADNDMVGAGTPVTQTASAATPTPRPGPSLSEEEQKLVPQCSSTQQ